MGLFSTILNDREENDTNSKKGGMAAAPTDPKKRGRANKDDYFASLPAMRTSIGRKAVGTVKDMGQCISTPAVSGDTETAIRARWEAGGLGSGMPAYANQNYMSPSPSGKQHGNYTTNADVGLNRGNDKYVYLQDNKARLTALEAIDENASLKPSASPTRGPPAPTPRRSGAGPTMEATPVPSKVPDNWTRGELIGQGAFGSVYLGMDDDGHLMAVKQVSLSKIGGPQGAAKLAEHIRSLEAEVGLLQSLNHPNIVCYLGTDRTPQALNIFLEYVPGGSIASLLAKFGSFKESVVRVYTKQILMGLEYLHANGIIHRDIKGANILVDNTGLVKLADFGASKKIEDLVTMESGCKSVKGTPYWMAPEVITATGHGRQADIWSVACTVIEMATGKPPWSQFGSQVSAMFQIAKSKGPPTIPEHLSPDCKDFLYLCFNRNWRERPSAVTLLQHPFLADVVCRTVAAPMNNIAAGSDQATQIPAYRATVVAAVAPQVQDAVPAMVGAGAAAQRRSPSNNRPAVGLNTDVGQGSAVHSNGPRRQLNLDRVAGVGATSGTGVTAEVTLNNGVGTMQQQQQRGSNGLPAMPAATPRPAQAQQQGGYTASPSKQQHRPNVMASAPVFADLKAQDSAFGPPLVRSDGRVQITRPASTPRLAGGATHPQQVQPVGISNLQQRRYDEDLEATLVIPDPTVLGSFRRSGSSNISVEQLTQRELSQSEVEQHDQLRNSVSSTAAISSRRTPSGGSLMETLAMSGGGGDTVLQGDVVYDDGESMLRASLASTAQNSEMSDYEQTVAVSSRSHGSAGGSEFSRKSEFNPMEEPAWMGHGSSSLGSGMTSNESHDMMVTRPASGSRGAPSEEEATSVRPLISRPASGGSSDGGSMPPPAARRSHGNTPSIPRQSSINLSAHLGGRSGSGGSNKGSQQQQRAVPGHVHVPSEGPVVYTTDADLDLDGDGLPWDIPAVSGGGATAKLMAQSASLSSWRQPQYSDASDKSGSGSDFGRGDSPTGNTTQDLIIEALLEQAQQDITASMAVFEASRRASFGTTTSSGADSEGSLPATVANVTSTPSVMSLDLTEVISNAQHHQATSTATTITVHQLPRSGRSSPTKTYSRQLGPSPAVTPRNGSSLAPSRIAPSPARMRSSSGSGSLVPPSPSPAGSPSKRRTAPHAQQAAPMVPGYASPTKRYSASASGSYEQQLKAQREARMASGGSGGGYLARAVAAGTPAKSAANHPLRTPRKERADGRSASAVGAIGRTPARR